jgi:hypothetical protein
MNRLLTWGTFAAVASSALLASACSSSGQAGPAWPTVAVSIPPVGSGPNEIAGISTAQARDASADIAYIKAHPVPARPGMTAGIITSATWLTGQCKPQPAHTAAFVIGQVPCVSWSFTIITATGRTVAVTCGSIGHPCPALVPQNVMPGDEGQYLYVPSDGRITPSSPVDFLECTTPGTYPCPSSAAVVP